MARKPRYRPPASAPPANAPGFDRWILEQLRLIGEDLHGAGTADVDTLIRQERLDLPAGATRRVSPTLSGTVVVLEAPSAENVDQQATLIIEDPRGSVTVSSSPHIGSDGKVTLSLINGERTATFTRSGVVVFHSNGIDQWKTVAESPAESGAIGATGPTGPAGPAGEGGAFRRLRRYLFKPDGTCDVTENGSTTNVALTTFGLSELGTDGKAVKVWVCPGGTGGSRSAKQRNSTVSDNVGAGGPGGAAINEDLFFSEDLEAYIAALGTDIPITAGAGGAGAPNGNFGEINTVGALGTLGGLSAFGALCVAYPGGRGQAPGSITSSAIGGGGGGGWGGPGIDGSASSATGGRPVTNLGTSNTQGDGHFGGGTGYQGSTTASPGMGVYGGGGGGGNSSGAGANGLPAGRSLKGVPGAGSGGSIDLTGVAPRNGGAAGKRGFYTDGTQTSDSSVSGGGPAGGTGVTGTTGNDGADGADGIPGLYPGESGGGGGALVCTASGGSGLSGRGGDGGYPGGSGGSGGACFNDSDTLVTNCAAGGGGEGADGCVVADVLG